MALKPEDKRYIDSLRFDEITNVSYVNLNKENLKDRDFAKYWSDTIKKLRMDRHEKRVQDAIDRANKPKPTQKESGDLGYANGWTKTPAIVKKCEELGHKQSTRNVGKSVTEVSCGICGYKYEVDSSD